MNLWKVMDAIAALPCHILYKINPRGERVYHRAKTQTKGHTHCPIINFSKDLGN